jgi:hypothetical protein
MRAAVAFVTSSALLFGACFPDNEQHRTIAKLTEGGFVVGGIALLAVVNTGADCKPDIAGMPDVDCEDKARLLGSIGLGMILAGLIGFITTVSTSPDDKPDAPKVLPEPPKPEPPVMQSPAPTAPGAPGQTEPTPPPTEPTPPAPTEPPPAPAPAPAPANP